MSPESADDALTKVRARLFLIFLKRLHVLHRNRPAPESFYIGQDYVEDHARVDCTIAVNFLCPGQVKQFEFWQRGTKVNGTQFENVLLVRAYRKISIQLWDDLRLKGVGQQFVIGYVKTLLPSINRRLIENRYSLGHPLSRTFAIFEAMDVSVTVNDRRIWLSWPISIPLFPPSAQLSNDVTVLYIRDYIDAIHAFFRSEYDDCIRRVITATESFLETKKWKAKRSYREYLIDIINKAFGFRRNNSHSLRRRLSDNLCKKLISNLVINENLQYVYKIRNKI
ncbi:MAG: hypothetical protein P4M15_03255, partial [Alphaproteobacteria bacterium]|nr:hypothetical protein [Alphaproteobacteria bacterium]